MLRLGTLQARPDVPGSHVLQTADHRVIDGREAVSFLVLVKKLIEDPALLNLYN